MGSKVKCPGCGAKNDAVNRRCRICTTVINLDAPVVEAASPEPSSPMVDHFDAGDINRQVQPARARFATGPSGLGARIAAAGNGVTGSSAQPAEALRRRFSSDSDLNLRKSSQSADADDGGPCSSVPTSAPIELAEERFDPDALFRDLG